MWGKLCDFTHYNVRYVTVLVLGPRLMFCWHEAGIFITRECEFSSHKRPRWFMTCVRWTLWFHPLCTMCSVYWWHILHWNDNLTICVKLSFGTKCKICHNKHYILYIVMDDCTKHYLTHVMNHLGFFVWGKLIFSCNEYTCLMSAKHQSFRPQKIQGPGWYESFLTIPRPSWYEDCKKYPIPNQHSL